MKHSAKQYVVGAVHTNTIEGFWSIFKRGIVGSFHKVSAKYMPLYVAEFQFRYNHRHNGTFSEPRLSDARSATVHLCRYIFAALNLQSFFRALNVAGEFLIFLPPVVHDKTAVQMKINLVSICK
ncbi:MAG: hypothetical protein QOJ86_967 [Bradyrhizobium sp.]|nr:hypothetical protein [Bradyrhizobium sp.]